MGQFLMVGLATKIEVDKKDERWGITYTEEQILSDLKQHFDLEIYDLVESQEKVKLVIKQDIFTQYIAAFVEQQVLLATGKSIDTKLLEILNSGDYSRMAEVAQEKKFCEFQAIQGISGYGINLRRMYIKHSSIVFFIEGKAYLECYHSLFDYISNLVKSSTQNPLKGAILPMLE